MFTICSPAISKPRKPIPSIEILDWFPAINKGSLITRTPGRAALIFFEIFQSTFSFKKGLQKYFCATSHERRIES